MAAFTAAAAVAVLADSAARPRTLTRFFHDILEDENRSLDWGKSLHTFVFIHLYSYICIRPTSLELWVRISLHKEVGQIGNFPCLTNQAMFSKDDRSRLKYLACVKNSISKNWSLNDLGKKYCTQVGKIVLRYEVYTRVWSIVPKFEVSTQTWSTFCTKGGISFYTFMCWYERNF
jgi:hypothetical protein